MSRQKKYIYVVIETTIDYFYIIILHYYSTSDVLFILKSIFGKNGILKKWKDVFFF